MAVIRTYDTVRHPFDREIARILGVPADALHLVHIVKPELLPEMPLATATETRTKFHDLVVAEVIDGGPSGARDVYRGFIADVVAPLIDDDFVYQAFPTFRLQLPGEMAVHAWHYDSDSDHAHPDWEINFQIALTDMRASRATWIESVPGLRDFAPMELTVGQFAIFDGNRCLHGNKRNETEFSRVSLDFRVLPWNRYAGQSSTRTSVNAGKRFVVGEYYERFQRRAGALPL
jgi:hypothetical protein